MRYPRLGLALAAAGCVLAVAAAPALGATKKEFYASPMGNSTKGVGVGTQSLTFGAIKIFCQKAGTKGKQGASPLPTFGTEIHFSMCHTEAKIGAHPIQLATHFKTPLVVEYHNNGFVETGSETVEEEGSLKLAGGTVELLISGGSKFKCEISWPEQTLPLRATKFPEEEYSAASYKNVEAEHTVTKVFTEGKQDRLQIENAFKAIKFEYIAPNAEAEEAAGAEPCNTWGKEKGPEGRGGRYSGTLEEQVTGGDLEFRSSEEEPF
jgi:hypothetical protein